MFAGPQLDYAIHYQDNGGVPPVTNTENGMTASVDYGGRFLQAIAVTGNGVMLAYDMESNPDIAGKLVFMKPHETKNGSLVWACQGGKVPKDNAGLDLPIAGTAAGFPLGIGGTTTVPVVSLPAFCRP